MKTTRKALPLICLMMTVMLLMASCDLSFIPGLNSDSTTPAPQTAETTPQTGTSNNSPQETPIDISKIPESQGLAYTPFDDGTCGVYGIGTCRDTVVRIPESIDGYRVTELAWFGEGDSLEEMLEQIDGVTTIIIPKTVTKIHRGDFVCGKLNAIVVDPENPIYYSEGNCVIERISKTLVLGCNGSVIPKDVTRIGDCAFACCSDLKTLTIPASVTSIGGIAFAYCPALVSIAVDSGNTAYYTTENCLIEKATKTVIAGCGNTITIPNGVKTIAPHVFFGCDALTNITIPNSVTSIGYAAFQDCDALTNITIPNSVTSIGDYTFADCDALTNITIPNSVTSIGYAAFQDCDALTNIIIPDSVTSISYTFNDCDNLTSIDIGKNIMYIWRVFGGCSSLRDVTFRGTIDEWCRYHGSQDFNVPVDEIIVHCTDGDTTVIKIKETVPEEAWYGDEVTPE